MLSYGGGIKKRVKEKKKRVTIRINKKRYTTPFLKCKNVYTTQRYQVTSWPELADECSLNQLDKHIAKRNPDKPEEEEAKKTKKRKEKKEDRSTILCKYNEEGISGVLVYANPPGGLTPG